MENRIFENTVTYGIPNIDVKVILFVNSRWDEEIFGKFIFHTREGKISYFPCYI